MNAYSKNTYIDMFKSGVVVLLLLAYRAASEDPFCGNKCYGEGVVTSQKCHCDLACSTVYNDCCADSKYFAAKRTNVSEDSTWSVTCKRKALVVNSCLKQWNGPDFIVNSCKLAAHYEIDPVGNAPVTSEATGITYSNYYCAICNGDAENVVVWNIKMSCPLVNGNLPVDQEEAFRYIFYNRPTKEWGYVIRNTTTNKSSFHGCAITAEIPKTHESKVRRCDLEEVSGCYEKWKSDVIRQMCGSYTDPVYGRGKRYKNFYCAICNRVDQSNLNCGEAVVPRVKTPDSEPETNKLSFSMLLDINFSEGNSVGKRLALLNCQKGEIFDPFARRCRNIVCGIPGYILQNGLCVADIPPELV